MPSSKELIQFKYGLQTNFDLIPEKDANTVYFVTDSQRLFVGDVEYSRPIQHGSELPQEFNPPNSLFVKETATGRELHYSKDGESWDLISVLPAKISGGVFGNNESLTPNYGETFVVPKITVNDRGFITGAQDLTITLPAKPEDIKNTIEVNGEGNAVTSGQWDEQGHKLTLTKGETFATKSEHDQVAQTANNAMPIAGGTFTGDVKVIETPEGDTSATSKGYVDKQDKHTLNQAKSYADGLLGANDAMLFKGTVGGAESGATVTNFGELRDYKTGWTYKVIEAGTYANHKVEIGDMLIAVSNFSESFKNEDWTAVQTNIDGAVTSEGNLVSDNILLGNNGQTVKDSGVALSTLATKAELGNKVDKTTTIAITGGATAEAVQLNSGSVSLNVTALEGSSVNGAVGEATHATNSDNATNATKATQDASGNVITETYATKTELNDNKITWGTF